MESAASIGVVLGGEGSGASDPLASLHRRASAGVQRTAAAKAFVVRRRSSSSSFVARFLRRKMVLQNVSVYRTIICGKFSAEFF
jgi:hypothetical protein